jgi:NAD(P)-dependent dehydrogenase (short-subunit alcohol dehydrogenase family)
MRRKLLTQAAAATLVGRNGTADDLGQAVAFIVNDGFVTGTVLEVDGGLRLS